MNTHVPKSSEHFRESQDSLTGVTHNPEDHDQALRNAHNEAYYAEKAQMTESLKDQMKDSLASAKDGIVLAKDQVLNRVNECFPTTQQIAQQDQINPTESSLARSEIEKDSIDQEAVKEKLEDMIHGPIEGMPGAARYHPHPDKLENIGFATKAGDTMKAGLESVQTSLQPILRSTQTGLRNAKKRVWRKKIQPIESGMPGRNHPHAERFYAPAPTLMDRMKTGWTATQTSANIGLATVQTGLISAKNTIFGEKIVPIEGGMPGRNHPHAERFYAKTPSAMDKMKDGLGLAQTTLQEGLVYAQTELSASSLKDKMQEGLVKAQTGFTDTKKRVWGTKIEPIEGGMPGRNHPHPERFEVKTPGLMTTLGDRMSAVSQRIFGEKIQPIEGGMPGRNHPHPEPFEAGLLLRLKEKVFPEKPATEVKRETEVKHEVEHVPSVIETSSISNQEATKEQLEPILAKETIHPLQGMPGPGRNHPMGESLIADDESLIAKLSDKWKTLSIV